MARGKKNIIFGILLSVCSITIAATSVWAEEIVFTFEEEMEEEILFFEEEIREEPETSQSDFATEPAWVEEEILETEEMENLNSQQEKQDALSLGMYGDEVLQMQQELHQFGYLSAEPDGWFGNQSEKAVRKFQLYNGLEVTGIADDTTLKLLHEGNGERYRILWRGDWGFAVYSLQRVLYELGYLPIAPDGGFGAYTEAALKAFQAAQGLEIPDGGFGNWTFEQLVNQADPFQELTVGSYGNSVKVMQQKLYDLGYLAVTPDGSFGGYSARAVQKFQLYHGIEPTGAADANTLNAIYRSENKFQLLSRGSYGTAVLGVQKLLWDLGYLEVEPDGGYGNITARAVQNFQKANGLTADGIVGKYTLEVLLQNPVTYQEYRDSVVVTYGGTYVITSSIGNYVLDTAGASVSDGANIQLYSSNDTNAQKWVVQNAGDGYYYLRNLKSWKCLDVVGNNAEQHIAENGSGSQRWKIVKKSDGGYQMINEDGMALAASSGLVVDETNVIGEIPDDSMEQTWYLSETVPGTALDFKTDGVQYIGIRSFQVFQGNVTEITGYYNIQTSINLPSGGYSLSGGDNYSIGLKVMYVNSFLAEAGYLSWDYYNYNRYDGNTVWAVRQFQSDQGMTADGIVGLYTWRAMGYSDYDFYNLGAYTTALKVYAYGSDRSAYIQAMLNTAAEYAAAGTGFKDGASGKPGTYVDCSGLIYQCLYAAGINPDTNIIDHARVVYEYTSAYLGSDWKLGVSVANAQPGDLIFYGGSSINHVAIYAGGGMIYDAWPGLGVTYRGMYSGGTILKIVRVF